jgi:histidine triad (HIT) family protein
MGACFICNKHQGEIATSGSVIDEDEYVYAKSNYLGHLMIDLKRHAPTLAYLTMEEASAFGRCMAKLSRALKESEEAEHIYSLVSGNSVPHLHMHLVPRYPGTPEKHWGPMSVYDWDQAPIGNEKEVSELCGRIKANLEEQKA